MRPLIFIKAVLIQLTCLVAFHAQSQVAYSPDILGPEFEQATIKMPSDYEGEVVVTLIRYSPSLSHLKAVLYIHGFNDYFFQTEMAERFAAEGYAFYALDLRKYGRSWRKHQKFNNARDLSEYFADIDTALAIIQAEGKKRIVLSGHSTGGLTTALYAAETQEQPRFDAVVLNSPFFDFNLTWVEETFGVPAIAGKGKRKPDKILKSGISTLYGESLYKDDKGEWAYNLQWKPHASPPVNCGWIRAIHNGQKKLKKGVKVSKPLLIMHSAHTVKAKVWNDEMLRADAVLDVKDIAKVAEKIQGHCSVISIDGGMHDLILSAPPVRDLVYAEVFAWLAATLLPE